jgi:hypothetical protein
MLFFSHSRNVFCQDRSMLTAVLLVLFSFPGNFLDCTLTVRPFTPLRFDSVSFNHSTLPGLNYCQRRYTTNRSKQESVVFVGWSATSDFEYAHLFPTTENIL